MSSPNERTYNLWVVVRPAADLKGQWVAHCLDLDLVTYGNSLRHAMDMVHEAAEATILDDLNSKNDPMDRRAPRECWDEMWKKLMPRTQQVPDVPKLFERESAVALVIAQLTMSFVRTRPDAAARAAKAETPAAWSEPAREVACQ